MSNVVYKHTCHAQGCAALVPSSMFMCRDHWLKLPARLRAKVNKYYRKGQEIDKNPSEEYLNAARDAIAYLNGNQDS